MIGVSQQSGDIVLCPEIENRIIATEARRPRTLVNNLKFIITFDGRKKNTIC
jgi:hypothetical protein